MKFSLIACINRRLAIGNENKLLYHIPNDLENFRRMTTNNVIIMGRKTFESLPNQKPLPNRINIVITSNKDWEIEGDYENLFVVNDIETAVGFCEAYYSDKECFVIGGESIYNEFIERELVETMYLTVVNDDTEGDAHFPKHIFEDDRWYTFYSSYTQRHRPTETTYRFKILKKLTF